MKWDPLVLICSDILKTFRVASNPNYIVPGFYVGSRKIFISSTTSVKFITCLFPLNSQLKVVERKIIYGRLKRGNESFVSRSTSCAGNSLN